MNDGTDLAVADLSPAAQCWALISRAATDPNFDVEKMRALLDMQKELVADQAKAQFNEAYARLQLVLPRIKKGGIVEYKDKPAFTYAKWEDIDAAIRPLLNAEGFSLTFDTAPHQSGGILVTGKLLHSSGHEKTASIGPLPLDTSGGKNNLQGAGSTFAYGCRYTSRMLLNLIYEAEDDDGHRGGLVFITDEQVKRLSDLVMETKSDLNAFLQYMEVAGLPNIVSQDYAKAENALLMKKRKREAKPVAEKTSA